jgi:hypothetical protein
MPFHNSYRIAIGAAPPLTQALKTYIDDLKTKGYLDNLPFTILK